MPGNSDIASGYSVIPLALVEMIERLDIEEKRILANLLDWNMLQQLREESHVHPGRVGDPRIYVGTTESGLDLELPIEYVPDFLIALSSIFSPQHVEILIQNGQGIEEYRCATADLEEWLAHHSEVWQEGAMMIELGSHTLVSGGGGCMSLALEDMPPAIHRQIAQMVLQLCGYDYTFSGDHFSAIVWEDQLEVTE